MDTGRQLGRYHLLRLLGFGGMGEVYLASARGAAGFEKLVTVKILRKQLSQNPERISDLLREAFIGVRLDHENIVQVFDLGEHEGTYFLVMEYVRGFSLREVISFVAEHEEPLPLRPVAHVVRCVADALEYLHRVRGPHKKRLDLVHRDVSPSNILLGAEGRIKLSDFGVAGMAQDAARAGAVIGKPRYLPPEARHGQPATQAWDLYALGVVLHSALAGDPDVEQSGNAGISVIGARLPPLAPVRPDVPPALVELVERATARDPADRLADAAELRRLLDAAVPRQADDVDYWRRWLQDLYRREDFVTRFGVLPHVEDLVPELESKPQQPSAAYVETVVVDAARPVRFGISPALGPQAARSQGERVAAWLKRRLERDVRPVLFGDYQSLVDALAEGEVDFAWMPPVAFVQGAERGVGVVALAERYGRPAYESAIVVRADAPIHALADLRGRSIAYVDRNSASGYVYGAELIARELGSALEDVFREQQFSGSHKAVCDAVLRGWVDAGTTYVVRDAAGRIVYSGWLDLTAGGELRVLALTDPIPCDAIAHRPGLAVGLIERLAKTVCDVDPADAEAREVLEQVFHTTGMVRADLRLYDAVRDRLQRLARR